MLGPVLNDSHLGGSDCTAALEMSVLFATEVRAVCAKEKTQTERESELWMVPFTPPCLSCFGRATWY